MYDFFWIPMYVLRNLGRVVPSVAKDVLHIGQLEPRASSTSNFVNAFARGHSRCIVVHHGRIDGHGPWAENAIVTAASIQDIGELVLEFRRPARQENRASTFQMGQVALVSVVKRMKNDMIRFRDPQKFIEYIVRQSELCYRDERASEALEQFARAMVRVEAGGEV